MERLVHFLPYISVGVAALVCGIAWMSVRYWREKFYAVDYQVGEAVDDRIRAQRESDRTQAELENIKLLIASMTGRPVIATLNDQQAQQLIQACQYYISTNKSGAN